MDNGSPLDLSKVISVITQNPALIAEISALVKKEGHDVQQKEEESAKEEVKEEAMPTVTEASTIPSSSPHIGTRNRQQLLAAFKPYLSGERARAIDSMLSISDILHSFTGR